MLENPSRVIVGIALDQINQRMRANIIAAIFGRNLFDATAGLLLIFDILSSEQGCRAVFCDKAKSSFRRRGTDNRHIRLDRLRPGLALVQGRIRGSLVSQS